MLQAPPVFPRLLPESQFHEDCSALLSNWIAFVGGNRGADITGLHALSQHPYAKRWLLPRVIWHPLAVSALGRWLCTVFSIHGVCRHLENPPLPGFFSLTLIAEAYCKPVSHLYSVVDHQHPSVSSADPTTLAFFLSQGQIESLTVAYPGDDVLATALFVKGLLNHEYETSFSSDSLLSDEWMRCRSWRGIRRSAARRAGDRSLATLGFFPAERTTNPEKPVFPPGLAAMCIERLALRLDSEIGKDENQNAIQRTQHIVNNVTKSEKPRLQAWLQAVLENNNG
jgi:hypothetical protein